MKSLASFMDGLRRRFRPPGRQVAWTPWSPITVSAIAGTFLRNREWFSEKNPEVKLLTEMVMDLFVEVEALRAAMLGDAESDGTRSARHDDAADASLAKQRARYKEAYVETAILLHNGAGTTSGVEKLLQKFYPMSDRESDPRSERWLKNLPVRRLGLTEKELANYDAGVRHVSRLT